jgi:hypothetical protein
VRKAMELDHKVKYTMGRVPLLINGDDCVFPMKDIKIWEKMAATVGLFNSVGKTFHSSKFIEMNSLTFLRVEESFHRVAFLNWGLLRGLKRSAQFHNEANEYNTYSNMGSNHHELMFGLDDKYELINKLYIQLNWAKLSNSNMSGIQWYIPEWLGGLGLYPGPHPEKVISEEQLKQAYLVYKNVGLSTDLSPNGLGMLETCTVHKLINSITDEFFDRFNGSSSSDSEEGFTTLETQELKRVNLEEEYRKVYREVLEVVWRNTDYFELFPAKTTDEVNGKTIIINDPNFIQRSKQLFYKKMRRNGELYRNAYRQACEEDVKCMKWHKLWKSSIKKKIPIALRDQKCESVVTYLYSHGLSLRPELHKI